MTFDATLNPVVYEGGIPIFIDTERDGSLNLLFEAENTNHVVYKIGVIFNYLRDVPIRNLSVFWEPGLYGTAIIIALIFEILYQNRVSIFRLVLYHVCMYTTFSSAGIILIVMCDVILLDRLCRNVLKYDKLRYLLFFGAFAGLIFLLMNLDKYLVGWGLDRNQYYAKLLSDNFQNSSRLLAVSHNIEYSFDLDSW